MTTETRTEIVLFSALAAFLLFLWWANRAGGAGTGLEGFLPAITDPTAGPLFDVRPAGKGGDVNFAGSTFNIGGPSFGAATPGNCNCPASSTAPVFGSNADLAAFLASDRAFTAATQDALTNWT